jgi:hypothetical protein
MTARGNGQSLFNYPEAGLAMATAGRCNFLRAFSAADLHCQASRAGVTFARTDFGFGRMSDEKKELPASDPLKNSSLYREFQAEREEILKHKWIESEKAGHDIGFERALTEWIVKHRSKWRKARQMANQ